jgi:acyl-CoA reductase-like NAD-dependent aldehyde dehydrogenase
MQERSDDYSRLETLNTGKTLRQSVLMDIPLAIEHVRYFSSEDAFTFSRTIKHTEYPGTHGIVQYAPVGVVAAVAPWNLPLLMAVWKVAPAILAGNTVVLKPSHFTPLTSFELAKDAKEVGFPDGVINVVTGEGEVVGDALAANDKVNMISFTGSTRTGKKLVQRASTSGSLKKITLELGGKSPNIVFEDANMEEAAKGVLFGIFLNSGQLCESGSRLLVQESVKEKFLSKLAEFASRMRPGNPLDMETDVSAITTEEQLEKINAMVGEGVGEGAEVLFQKEVADKVPAGGLYFPPTIMGKVSQEMKLANEEVFGPVLSVLTYSSEDEAVEIANSTRYGLACGVWTSDLQRAEKVASRIEAGTVWINEYHLLSAAAPRGGFKDSGIGRELGYDGILEFTQTRHLFVNEKTTGSDIDEVAYGLVVPGS